MTFKLGYGRFVASTIDNVVGFSRALGAPVNGLPVGFVYNQAANAANGLSPKTSIPNFSAGTTLTNVNGTPIILPADLTPYNYLNNVNGLRNLFTSTIAGMLTTANFGTGGRQLLASDFSYPTTETLNFGFNYKFSERANVDVMCLYSKTKHQTVQFVTDGSAPQATSYGPLGVAGGDMGDSIFLSNQTSSNKQVQVKYMYNTSKMSFMATFLAKEFKSSAGGDAGSFSNSQTADFYGTGAPLPWVTGQERAAAGTEAFSGAFAWTYHTDFGTDLSLLGQWHSGKYYDIYLGYNPNPAVDSHGNPIYGPGGNLDAADPNLLAGTGTGQWNLDMGFKVQQTFSFSHNIKLIPYIMVQNLLNNYDYGNNYQNQLFNGNGSYNTQLGSAGPISRPTAPGTRRWVSD